jgi:zinc transporter ZupT
MPAGIGQRRAAAKGSTARPGGPGRARSGCSRIGLARRLWRSTTFPDDPLLRAALLAFLIALQNLPEAFNAFREMTQRRPGRRRRTLLLFAALPLVGPACAWLGAALLAGSPRGLGALMLACAGGILYLTFQDVAPKAHLARHWAPALGAVGGFALGLLGVVWTG